MKKCAIIYLPNGHTLQFSTVDLGDSNWPVVEDIRFDSENVSITIVQKDDNKTDRKNYTRSYETYCGIPFSVESWD